MRAREGRIGRIASGHSIVAAAHGAMQKYRSPFAANPDRISTSVAVGAH